jgi:polyisoprenoid-binding protein YceI
MSRSLAAVLLVALAVSLAPLPAEADPISFKVLYTSRAAFKTDAPLETIVGTTSGEAVTGSLIVDPARPQGATGSVRVDLTTLKTGIEKRDADMRAKNYLDTEVEANKYAVFEVKGVEASGALEPGRETPAKVRGVLTIKGKPVEIVADARVTYQKLTLEQLESTRRFGFTSDMIRVKSILRTTFTDHGMQVPQVLFLKLPNDIQLEAELTFVRQ